ncbi:MAG: putative molybdenum carrier protein [Gammaproteobacteria bacterium]
MSFLRFSLPLSTEQIDKPTDKQFTIISGGQTGVDRAALDVAIKLGIPHGGWCPKGRLAEDGSIAETYLLKETNTTEYSERTIANIIDSDATLIILPSNAEITDGTILTIEEVKRRGRQYLIMDIADLKSKQHIFHDWLLDNNVIILNVAGPRESQFPGIYKIFCESFETMLILAQQVESAPKYR